MDSIYIISIAGVGCYVVASILALASLLGAKPRGERAAISLMTMGGVILAGVLIFRGVGLTTLHAFNCFDAMGLYALALSGAYGLWAAYRYTPGIAGILIPYATLLLLCGVSSFRVHSGDASPVQGAGLMLHVATAYAAFGVFTLASISAVIYLVQDGNLKNKRFGVLWSRLPSLGTMDHVMSRLIGVAFLLLTISILTGIVLIRRIGGGEEWIVDPKVVATFILWLVLAVFVHLRASSGRHGRGIALVAVFGLGCLLFAFIGVHLVATSIHSFIQVSLRVGGP
ncbi:MAG: cytochrome c biogenesis protein CcsA [bacterium]